MIGGFYLIPSGFLDDNNIDVVDSSIFEEFYYYRPGFSDVILQYK